KAPPPSFILLPTRPHKATVFTHLKSPRGPLPQFAGEGGATGRRKTPVFRMGCGPLLRPKSDCTTATANLRRTIPAFRAPSGLRPPSPLRGEGETRHREQFHEEHREFDLCEYCTHKGGGIRLRPIALPLARPRIDKARIEPAPLASASASPAESSGVRIRWTGVGHQATSLSRRRRRRPAGPPFSAKRGRRRVAADGVRKAGMDRRRSAVTVVQI